MKTAFLFLLTILITSAIVAGCNESKQHEQIQSGNKVESPLIRDYEITVSDLDENKDGKIFQCPMDWEVISDTKGTCPLCNMKLREYTVSEAQQNLTENKP